VFIGTGIYKYTYIHVEQRSWTMRQF